MVNNQPGVLNSIFLEKFSQNTTIRRLGILLKKWARQEELIDKKKLSSYGVILMMIYYLMRTGNLDFVTSEQLISLSFESTLRN